MAFAKGPKYVFKDPLLVDEFVNAYKDIEGKQTKVLSFTKAQLFILTPSQPGIQYYCSNCSTDGMVISTAATRGGFGRISARTTAIN